MTNVEKLKHIGILGDVRQRLGAENEDDPSIDDKINEMDNSELIEAYCGWRLGYGQWWTTMKTYYDELERLSD